MEVIEEEEIVNIIYDEIIEDKNNQVYMRSVIKSWIRQAFRLGELQGKKKLVNEIKETFGKTKRRIIWK